MTIATPHRALLVFARNPRVGRVKTRLIGALGAQQATHVYLNLLRRTLATTAAACVDSTRVYLTETAPDKTMQQILDDHDLPWSTQQGEDLGVRMLNAIADALRSASQAVLIGTDCPEFDPDYLASAFDALTRADVVIGPAADGGYVLIGMRQAHAGLFGDLPWGSDRVLELTRQRLSQLQLSWHELTALHDVDTAADLARFPQLTERIPGPS